MELQELEPNDIVIHLINPYKCGDCGSEFCERSVFLEHLTEHLEKLKCDSPCHQIVCFTNLVEHQPNGITITRDILQINEQQVFELQESSRDYSNLTPLKTLERAGILNLPPPRQTHSSPAIADHREKAVILTVEENSTQFRRKKISLLGNPQPMSQVDESIHLEVDGNLDVKYNDAQVCVEGGSIPTNLVSVQQVFLDSKVKEEINIVMEGSSQNETTSILMEGERGDFVEPNSVFSVQYRKKYVSCPICFNLFSTSSALERHQVMHSNAKLYPCMKCFKQFNDASSMRKHMLIHRRQHRCPICHKMFLQRSQLSIHMKQHSKRRFIQFGSSFHEVKVEVTRTETGQQIQEYSLLILLSEEELKKVNMQPSGPYNEIAEKSIDSYNNVHSESTESPIADITSTKAVLQSEIMEENTTQLQNNGEQKKKIIYKCGHCKRLIFTRPTLSRHLIKHTNTRPFHCDICSKTFRDKADLFHHKKTHTKPVQCNTCNTSFSKVLYLQNHLLKGCPVYDMDDRFTLLDNFKCQCNVCKKVLKNKANILRHLRVHAFQDSQKRTKRESTPMGEKKDGTVSANIEDHYRGLENSVGFECLLCGQEFRFKSFMITHVRMHLNQRPFKCDQCSKRFFAPHMLKKHMQNHTRPYKCPVCDKGFIRRYLMKDHYVKRHERESQEDSMKDITELFNEKKLQCDICGKTMKSYQKSLMQHHIRQHKDVRPFVCELCQKAFTSDTALKKHSLNHTRPYACQVCGKSFSRRYLLIDHFKKKCNVKLMGMVKSSNSDAQVANNNTINKEVNVTVNAPPSEENAPFKASMTTLVCPVTGSSTYFCQPCNKKFHLYDALLRHVNTFAKPTPCKYCATLFEDKHLAVVHQRSCLGVPIDPAQKSCNKSGNQKVLGEQQAKVKKMMKDLSEKICEQITASPAQEEHALVSTPANYQVSENTVPESLPVKTPQNEVQLSLAAKVLHALREEDGKYNCPECKKSFTSIRGMKIHASCHVRLFKCQLCDQDFTNIMHMRAHAQTHKDVSVEEPVENTSDNYEDTIFVAEGLMPNSDNKNQVTVTPKHLTALRKKKKVETDSDDDIISQSKLSTKDILEVNQRLMCSGTRGRPYSCNLCRRRFTESIGLESHMLQIHGVKS
ncbi:zinc finger protein 836 [Biomphalaria glabrata]|nr:zinc finger protein 836-like [Biomphalaria glabrata]